MPNDFFQFQQFRIAQDQCAMKVSTDACLLGAATRLTQATRILDIGTGTALLALMAAQRHATATIEAIEIEPAAAAQATANVLASPWAARIRVRPTSLADYSVTRPAPFSQIICNPPFFQQSLPATEAARNTARHVSAASLSFEELAAFAAEYLLPDGTLTVLLPPPEMARFELAAQGVGLAVAKRLAVRHRPDKRITRLICEFGHGRAAVEEQELSIYDGTGQEYSSAFRALLAGFYLAF